MTANPDQNNSDRERPTRNSSYTYPTAPADESPDLLRWRADSLLDEMMLGGVDVSAADGSAPLMSTDTRPQSSAPASPDVYDADAHDNTHSNRPAYPERNGLDRYDPAGYQDHGVHDMGYSDVGSGPESEDVSPFEPEPDDPPSTLSSQYSGLDSYRSVLDAAPTLDDDQELSGPGYGESAQGGGDSTPRRDRLYSLEQEYETFRRNQSSRIQPVPIQDPKPTPSAPVTPPPPPPRERPDELTQWANTPEKWEWQDFSAAPGEAPDPTRYLPPPESSLEDSAVRQDQAQFVSAMSVMGGGKRRSTLLPRMSTLDVDAVNQEIATLHGELGNLLPVGHESSERARHLLDKAYSILQSDPTRSAEVEYYMQQVRTIVQRLRQARHWSDLYRDRLRMYLTGWIFLTSLVLLARYIFPGQLEGVGLALLNGSAAARHWPTFTATVAAGALGGAVGALYTMSQHIRSDYGLFDRKYGLRGLLLPIIPAVLGALIYLPIGFFYSLTGIDPALHLWADVLPMMAAFAFGFSQESLYGTRG